MSNNNKQKYRVSKGAILASALDKVGFYCMTQKQEEKQAAQTVGGVEMQERKYDIVSRIDKDGNIWTGTRSRCPHFDWLNRSILGEHYVLCGADSVLTKIEGNIYTFTECEPYLPREDTTVIQFLSGQAWLMYDSVQFFEAEKHNQEMIKRFSNEDKVKKLEE